MRMIASFYFVGGRESFVASSISSSLSIWGVAFVDRNPLLVLRPWRFNVSSDSGKFLLTASHVRPGHDAYCLFLMALSHDGLVGKPAAAW
jgi:hypothetical protein